MRGWADSASFALALLAALCAENIPLALGLTLAAVLAMALPQILNRLGIWAKREPPRCYEHRDGQDGHENNLIHPYFKGFEGEMQA